MIAGSVLVPFICTSGGQARLPVGFAATCRILLAPPTMRMGLVGQGSPPVPIGMLILAFTVVMPFGKRTSPPVAGRAANALLIQLSLKGGPGLVQKNSAGNTAPDETKVQVPGFCWFPPFVHWYNPTGLAELKQTFGPAAGSHAAGNGLPQAEIVVPWADKLAAVQARQTFMNKTVRSFISFLAHP
jgi:hypothetical protein